jgi:hypothetical protein
VREARCSGSGFGGGAGWIDRWAVEVSRCLDNG